MELYEKVIYFLIGVQTFENLQTRNLQLHTKQIVRRVHNSEEVSFGHPSRFHSQTEKSESPCKA